MLTSPAADRTKVLSTRMSRDHLGHSISKQVNREKKEDQHDYVCSETPFRSRLIEAAAVTLITYF